VPRIARKRSRNGVYHIIVQGKWKECIFGKAADKSFYLDILKKKQENGELYLYSYCIMDNCVHLVIGEKNGDISAIMRVIGNRYAAWFHKQYQTQGSIFRDRYRSEPIESDVELMRVTRFVHQLPVRYGICKEIPDYPWSSFPLYVQGEVKTEERIALVEMIGADNFVRYTNCCWKDKYLEENRKYKSKEVIE